MTKAPSSKAAPPKAATPPSPRGGTRAKSSGAPMRPYADDSASAGIGKLTVENGRDCVSIYGSLDLTRDRAGLDQARALHALLGAVVQALEAEGDLPAKLPPPEEPGTVANPFGS